MRKLETQTFRSGQRIITKDHDAVMAYIVHTGKVRVFLEQDTKEIMLAFLEEGDIFGEASLFGEAKYGANVEALEDCELIPIAPHNFKEKMRDCDPVLNKIIRSLIKRQRATNEKFLESETREQADIALI